MKKIKSFSKISKEKYLKKILSIKYIGDLEPEIKKMRQETEKRLKKLWGE